MLLRTEIVDCLYLNWALPRRALPSLPESLRYDTVERGGESFAFASAVLLRQRDIRLGGWPVLGLAHSQCNVRLYVLDAERAPALYFVRIFLPFAIAPAVRALLRQPAEPARFDFPRTRASLPAGPWRWRVEASGALEVEARPGAPASMGPQIGDWDQTVAFFRERIRGYALLGGRLRRLETSHPKVEAAPVRATIPGTSLLETALPDVPRESWLALHSSFLCPRIALTVEVEAWKRLPVPSQVPAAG